MNCPIPHYSTISNILCYSCMGVVSVFPRPLLPKVFFGRQLPKSGVSLCVTEGKRGCLGVMECLALIQRKGPSWTRTAVFGSYFQGEPRRNVPFLG